MHWIFQNRDVEFLLKIKMLYILNSWELSPSFDIRFRKFSGHHAVASLKPPQTSSNQNAFVEKHIHLLGCWRRAPIKFKWIEKANYWRYWRQIQQYLVVVWWCTIWSYFMGMVQVTECNIPFIPESEQCSADWLTATTHQSQQKIVCGSNHFVLAHCSFM